MHIFDTNRLTTPHLAAFKAAGYDTAIRYIRPVGDGGEAAVHPAEARAIAAHGMKLALVVEGAGNLPGSFSAATGTRDAKKAIAWAQTIGMPLRKGIIIWFAVDFDCSGPQAHSRIVPYFKSIRAVFGDLAKAGIYANGTACAALMSSGLVDAAWLSCSMGWSGSHAYLASGHWSLRQFVPHAIVGVDCDANTQNGDKPIGAFVPFAEVGSIAPGAEGPLVDPEIKWAQGVLNRLGNQSPELLVDGIEGAKTRAAIIAFQKLNGLEEDGIVGTKTVTALNEAYNKLPDTHGPVGAQA